MSTKSISGKNLDQAFTSDDLLGKDVIDADGSVIGVAEKIFIDPNSLDFIGISVDKGFLKQGLVIGKDYIERVTAHVIFLRIKVVSEIKNMKVFDRNGVLIGRIREVELQGQKNEIASLIISSIIKGIPKKILVSGALIEKIGYNVILRITKGDIFELNKKV
ncbi:MAG: PRC-barrel domain-containing protein [Nanoarchaeota archaeon]|nr:PRC-barrel domain-containing protein [Nanoarchaeota archaeon]